MATASEVLESPLPALEEEKAARPRPRPRVKGIRSDPEPVGLESPGHFARTTTPGLVSLRGIKTASEVLRPDHPLRVLLAGEPEEIPMAEYRVKLPGWARLVRARVD